MNLSFLSGLVDSGKLGGWVRAGVAAGLGAVVAKYPVVGTELDPSTQAAIATAAAGIVVGAWSHYVKT